ncbi:hypothetical protein ACFSHQ_21645 [Gemmobacter lanyuensis]
MDQGIARNLRVTNAELDAAFEGTLWADDDPIAQSDPEGLFLDLWLIDIGPRDCPRGAAPAGRGRTGAVLDPFARG